MAPSRTQVWLGIAAGAAAGFGLGYLAFGNGRAPGAPPQGVSSASGVSPSAPASGAQATRASPEQTAVRTGPVGKAPVDAGSAVPAAPNPEAVRAQAEATAELGKLRARVKELEGRLDSLAGVPLNAPANLDARFSERAVTAALLDALRETGSKAQLTMMDCSEYPCMAYFDSLSSADLEALKRSAAGAPYARDSMTLYGKAGPEGPYLGLTVFPKDDPTPRNDFLARLRYRFGEMQP